MSLQMTKTVHTGDEVGIDLYLRNILLHGSYQFVEELCFQYQNLLISTENLSSYSFSSWVI